MYLPNTMSFDKHAYDFTQVNSRGIDMVALLGPSPAHRLDHRPDAGVETTRADRLRQLWKDYRRGTLSDEQSFLLAEMIREKMGWTTGSVVCASHPEPKRCPYTDTPCRAMTGICADGNTFKLYSEQETLRIEARKTRKAKKTQKRAQKKHKALMKARRKR